MEKQEFIEKWGLNVYGAPSISELMSDLESVIQAEVEKREKQLREDMLKQMGHFMWILGEDEQDQEERSLLIGYDEKGMPDSVALDIFGRTHADFRYIPAAGLK